MYGSRRNLTAAKSRSLVQAKGRGNWPEQSNLLIKYDTMIRVLTGPRFIPWI